MRTSVVLVLCLSLALVSLQSRADAPATKPLHLDAHLSESYTDDLPGLMQKKYIRVLTTVNRTNFFIDDGELVGYEYSLLKGYESFLNQGVSRKELQVVFEFIPVARDELIPKLVKGYGDIAAAGLTITEERKKSVAFTDPYLTGVRELVVTPKGGFDPQSVEDLSGKRVYVRKSSSYYQSLTRLNTRLRAAGKEPVRIKALNEELETETILEMVNSKGMPITVADSHLAKAWSQVLKNIEIHEEVALRNGAEIAWMVRPNNPELLSSINAFLKTHKQGTLLGNIYFKRYYQNADKLRDPLEIEKWQNLERTREIIKKYALTYDFDWHLILALAFQESGLDHTQKSRAGAVGIMQVLPATAKDAHIDIDNVDQVENNVHAGVKYLDFLRDRYFSSDEIRPGDQVRLSLAAYNAGPAKIRKARNLAAKMGLDPNRWFRHVELAALRLIGRETVRYVSNINKYYVLYTTLANKQH